MKLKWFKGSHDPSTLPHPVFYRCKIIREVGGRSQVVSCIGPRYLLLVGWYETARKPN
jgi:hypothetical protein